jgi:hypothetical protein
VPCFFRVACGTAVLMRAVFEFHLRKIPFRRIQHFYLMNRTEHGSTRFFIESLGIFSNAPTRQLVLRIHFKNLLACKEIAVDWMNHFPVVSDHRASNVHLHRYHLADGSIDRVFIFRSFLSSSTPKQFIPTLVAFLQSIKSWQFNAQTLTELSQKPSHSPVMNWYVLFFANASNVMAMMTEY